MTRASAYLTLNKDDNLTDMYEKEGKGGKVKM